MLSKDERGIKTLYSNYANTLFGIISRIVKDKEIAEEVLQNTMLKAWNKIETFNKEKSSLYTWLAAIARNSALDKIRLKSYSNSKKTDSLSADVYNYGSINLSQSELDVQKLIGRLDDKYSVLLRLVYLEGYSQNDASKHLDIPIGTVKTRLRNAMKILRDDLKNEKFLFLGVLIIALLMLARLS